jgi:hypothetical protein
LLILFPFRHTPWFFNPFYSVAQTLEKKKALLPKGLKAEDVLADYRMAYQSRQASLLGRREVLTGKAKFGIFGDGKEVAQIAMARAAQPGDFRCMQILTWSMNLPAAAGR